MKKLLPLDLLNPIPKRQPESVQTGDLVCYDGSVFGILTRDEAIITKRCVVSVSYDDTSGLLQVKYSDGSECVLQGFFTVDNIHAYSDAKPGNEGKKGKRGRRGLNGRDGNPGQPGCPGVRGDVGKTGIPGNRGVRGLTGERGITGNRGSVGLQGYRGLRGDMGSDGGSGRPGPVGFAGLRGLKGKIGETGIRGEQGSGGCKGSPGLQGGSGYDGKQGRRGESGEISIVNGLGGIDGSDGIPSAVHTLLSGRNVTVTAINNNTSYKISAICGRSCDPSGDSDSYPCDLLLGEEFDLSTGYETTAAPTTTTTTTTLAPTRTPVPPGVPAPGVCTDELYPAVGYSEFTKSLDPTYANTEFVGADLGEGWEYIWKMYTDETIWHPPEGTVTHQSYYVVMAMPRDLEDFMLKIIRHAKRPGYPDCVSEGRQFIPAIVYHTTRPTVSPRPTTTIAPTSSTIAPTTRKPSSQEFFCAVDLCVMLDISSLAKADSLTLWTNALRAVTETSLMGGARIRLSAVCFGFNCFEDDTQSAIYHKLVDVTDSGGLNRMQQVVDLGFSAVTNTTDTFAAMKAMQLVEWGNDLENERYHVLMLSASDSLESQDELKLFENNERSCVEIIAGMAVDRRSFQCDVVRGNQSYHELLAKLGRGSIYNKPPSVTEIRNILTKRGGCPQDIQIIPPPEGATGCSLDVCLIMNSSYQNIAQSRQLLECAMTALCEYPYVMGDNTVKLSAVCYNDLCYERSLSSMNHDFVDTRSPRDKDALYSFVIIDGFGQACIGSTSSDILAGLKSADALSWSASSQHIFLVASTESTDSTNQDQQVNSNDCVRHIVGKVLADSHFRLTIINSSGNDLQWIRDAVSAGQGRVEALKVVPNATVFREKVNHCSESLSLKADYFIDSYYASGQAFANLENNTQESSTRLTVWDFVDYSTGTVLVTIKSFSQDSKTCTVLGSKVMSGRVAGLQEFSVDLLSTSSRVTLEIKLLSNNAAHRLYYRLGTQELSNEIQPYNPLTAIDVMVKIPE
jgi:hypothetical protein